MIISDYPQCCKAVVLRGFGAGHIYEADELYTVHNPHKENRCSKERVINYFNEALPRLQQRGISVVFACPTNHQPEAIEALTELGFYGASQEDLDDAATTGRIWENNEYKSKSGAVDIKHSIVPMFYLIKPLHKFVDNTDY